MCILESELLFENAYFKVCTVCEVVRQGDEVCVCSCLRQPVQVALLVLFCVFGKSLIIFVCRSSISGEIPPQNLGNGVPPTLGQRSATYPGRRDDVSGR